MAQAHINDLDNLNLQLDESYTKDDLQKQEPEPKKIQVFILGDLIPFPGVVFPLVLEDDTEKLFFEAVQSSGGHVAFFNRFILNNEKITVKIGILAKLLKTFRLPDGRTSVVIQCVKRAVLDKKIRAKPFFIAKLSYPKDITNENRTEFEPLLRQVKLKLEDLIKSHPQMPEELQLAAINIDDPSRLADFIGQNFIRDKFERFKLLSTLSIHDRLSLTLEFLIKELELFKVGNKISEDIQRKLESTQRQFYLREQFKAIRKELGEEADVKNAEADDISQKLKKQEMPQMVKTRVDSELKRLQIVPIESPEHGLIRNYLEWIADLPWSYKTDDIQDLGFAENVLKEDHFGLEEIKQRILEFLAIRQLNPNRKGGIICFIGPPGVGKTSLGRSIARAMGRKFYRFSLGGMRDEAEIKGHRRTYVGAMPGRILQGLKFLNVKNPVFMLDEIDKMGRDFRGDPASAMLEVLDPEQNTSFLDHYLDLPFDLSQVLFICTANVKSDIPSPLLDRMEVIELSGYIPLEKVEIATRYLLPKQITEHGLTKKQVQMTQKTLDEITESYTREAGVRGLERQIAKICRKIAFDVAKTKKSKKTYKIDAKDLNKYLGPTKFERDIYQKRPPYGVAFGLAWTPVGGDILFIEAKQIKGSGKLILTGQIGSVMNESAHLAMSLIRERQTQFNLPEKFFTENDLHVHFPAGSVPKDGPSAGITIVVVLASLLMKKLIKPRLAMTGEITLRGEVLPVGGIREKVVAAQRAGLKVIVLPEKNIKDLEEIPDYIKKGLQFISVASIEDVFNAVF